MLYGRRSSAARILGYNGIGETTLLKLLMEFLPASVGMITREVQPDDLGDRSLVGEFIGITT